MDDDELELCGNIEDIFGTEFDPYGQFETSETTKGIAIVKEVKETRRIGDGNLVIT